ncbi:hypothetical protein ACQ5SK_05330 [Bradyrhizobium japonicum]
MLFQPGRLWHNAPLLIGAQGFASLVDKALNADRGGVHCGSVRTSAVVHCESIRPDANIAGRKASISIRRYAFYLDFLGHAFQSSPGIVPAAGPSIPECFDRDGDPRFIRSIRIVIKILQKNLRTLQGAALRGGHARTSAGRFGEKIIAVSIIPSHAPADRASS